MKASPRWLRSQEPGSRLPWNPIRAVRSYQRDLPASQMNAQAEAQVTLPSARVCQPSPWTASPITEATLMTPPGLSNSTPTSRGVS
jgi:hypothetical protein